MKSVSAYEIELDNMNEMLKENSNNLIWIEYEDFGRYKKCAADNKHQRMKLEKAIEKYVFTEHPHWRVNNYSIDTTTNTVLIAYYDYEGEEEEPSDPYMLVASKEEDEFFETYRTKADLFLAIDQLRKGKWEIGYAQKNIYVHSLMEDYEMVNNLIGDYKDPQEILKILREYYVNTEGIEEYLKERM